MGVECGPCKLLDPCFNIQPGIVPKKAEEEAAASSRRSALVSRRAMVGGGGGLADGCRVCVCVAVAVGGWVVVGQIRGGDGSKFLGGLGSRAGGSSGSNKQQTEQQTHSNRGASSVPLALCARVAKR